MAKAVGMPKLIKRGGRFYVATYYPATGTTVRRSLRTSDPLQAVSDFSGWLQRMVKGQQPITVRCAIDDYLREHVAKKCADPGRQHIAAAHLIAFFGHCLLADVDIAMSRAYAAARRAGKIGGSDNTRLSKVGSDSTIRRELGVLSAVANHARKWKRISVDAMPSIERPGEGSPAEAGMSGEALFFSREQIARLLFTAQGEVRDIIKLCYYTAARRRSIECLTAGQIDFTRKKVNLATLGKKHTKKRQPVVPLFSVIEADVVRLTAGKKPGDQLFAARQFYKKFMTLCRALEFAEPHNPHMLRHSRATHLLQDGKKLYSVAALLGDTVKTVESNYGHHSANELMDDLE